MNKPESHGTFLENEVNLEDYTKEDTIPETPMMHQESKPMHLDDLCTYIVDNRTSHTILKCKEYFTNLTPSSKNMTTIMGSNQIEKRN
jgi:hypothetical protein